MKRCMFGICCTAALLCTTLLLFVCSRSCLFLFLKVSEYLWVGTRSQSVNRWALQVQRYVTQSHRRPQQPVHGISYLFRSILPLRDAHVASQRAGLKPKPRLTSTATPRSCRKNNSVLRYISQCGTIRLLFRLGVLIGSAVCAAQNVEDKMRSDKVSAEDDLSRDHLDTTSWSILCWTDSSQHVVAFIWAMGFSPQT